MRTRRTAPLIRRITLEQLRKGIRTERGGWVHVIGEGITCGENGIGLGVATYFARMDNGVTAEKVRKDGREDWVKDCLIPAGLIEERGGLFYRTGAADKAGYELEESPAPDCEEI